MTDTSNWIVALATVVVAVTAVISMYYNHKLISISIAKDKPFVRAYIKRFKNPPLPPILFVKNEEGGKADNVTLDIGGRKFSSFSLKANESEVIPVEVTDGLRIDRLTYEDIHGNKITESNIVPRTITADFEML